MQYVASVTSKHRIFEQSAHGRPSTANSGHTSFVAGRSVATQEGRLDVGTGAGGGMGAQLPMVIMNTNVRIRSRA